ncbi:MAG: metallophosphoesterase, partial [Candidatus Aminicenantales bacterium]
QGTSLVDQGLRWTGGQTHLVQIGDILDRGPGARKIFDLIRRLESEAAAAGGRVHMLIGNHEAIALMGLSFDYEGAVTVEQFLSFLPEGYRADKEAEFRRRAGPGADMAPFWDRLARTDLDAQSAYYEFLRDRYGRWIADHETAVKIDGVVFVHGGFNEEYSRWPLERLNRAVSGELLGVMMNRPEPPQIIFDTRGPLWYRDDAGKDEEIMSGEIDRVLRNLEATALVVGHTATIGSRTLEMSRMGGRVWTIDTGIGEPFSGRLGALVIEGGHFKVWRRDEERHEMDRRGRGLPVGGAGAAFR